MMKNKKCSIGTWFQINNYENLNLIKDNGFEWVVFDLEHGNFEIKDLTLLSQIAKKNNIIPYCRLSKPCENEAQLVLEKGVEGIIFPRVKNYAECQKLVKFCNYPPSGKRGIGFSASNLYGKQLELNIKKFKPTIIIMLENVTICDDLEKILKIKNLSGVFIGPYDLSASLGITGNFSSSKFKNYVKKITKIAKKSNKIYGTHVVHPNKNDLLIAKKNFNFIAYSLDTVLIQKYLKNPLV